jgi:dTDP-glucose 4,6-dehydratase
MMPKNVVVTGGAGFIAHHVIEYLLDNTDWNIKCLDRIDTAGNLNRLSDILKTRSNADVKRLTIIYHDLRAEINHQIIDMLGDVNLILHLAAASHVTRSIQYPLEFVYSNVVGTVNLLEYARKLKNLERFVYFSTDEVFGPALGNYVFTEYDRYNATNPYSASKAGAEEMCVAYHNTYKLPIYITHTMNVYGERQAPEKYIPMSIKKLLNAETLKIHYNTYSKKYGSRNYLYAKDVASALMHILSLQGPLKEHHDFKAGRCPKFNISAGKEYDNKQIAYILTDALDINMIYEDFDPNIDRPGHDFSYAISGEYLRQLGWSPKYSVEDTLPKVARWYRDNSIWLK